MINREACFLREITKRLNTGLEKKIPKQQERMNHIFKNQLFAIAITELTSLLARRSVYCSKDASSKYSIANNFDNNQGNILFDKIEHSWKNGKCEYCGASKENYDRGRDLESHAYQFIHTHKPEDIFNMKFDVIIGNPPYQLKTAGEDNSAQAKPIYHLFVEQAIKLNPRYISMIIPSRWFAGGWGLDDFRSMMMSNSNIRELHDFPDASECFPGPEIKGGVCYFSIDKSYTGDTKFITHKNGEIVSEVTRPLKMKDSSIVIRYNEALPILEKVRNLNEKSFSDLVSTKKPFGFLTNFKGVNEKFKDAVKLYGNRSISYVSKDQISRRSEFVNTHKLIIPKAIGSGDPRNDLIKSIYSEPNSCCTETYLLIGPFKSKEECECVQSYIQTKFFHFLVTLQKNTQDCMKKVYSFVPIQDFTEKYTDDTLYKKYQLSNEEINYIESIMNPKITQS